MEREYPAVLRPMYDVICGMRGGIALEPEETKTGETLADEILQFAPSR